ncbi:M13 family metallopeptidase [Acinetobacter wuhouensis]|uniref:M13 family peptidase n=1 Tax=Acinetobacter wuhouensis TaxID=1879050 RepID=A0A3G2T4M8_9GAMM|nr:M13 family metallopeptidase [Acinetobacter wuhouensis]AYO55233.1 M13 family peptidase [Acinetobacter wuhouensis]
MKNRWVKSVLTVAIMAASASLWAETVTPVSQSVQTVTKAQIKSGIDKQYFDHEVRANDDFFKHTNGLWLKNTEIPADKAGWGIFYQLAEESTVRLHGIVEELSKQNNAKGSTEQKVATLYADFMNEKAIEDLGIQPIQAEIDRVEHMKSKQDIAQVAAHFSRIGVTSPFDVGIDQDMKQSTEMIAMLVQSGLGLPDRDYYLKDDAKFKQTRSQYLAYIEKTLTLAGDQHAKQRAQEILKLETQIAKAQWSNVQNRDLPKLYNIYKVEDLSKLTSKVDWKAYLDGQQLSGKISKIQVAQPSYFKNLTPIINNTSLDAWKAYFKFHLISDFSPLLSKAFVDNSFEFYSHQLRDIKEPKVRWKRGVALVNGTLGESLGQVYVEKYFSPEKKQRMEHLVQNLMKAYSQSIDQLDWMSPTTKVQAQKKLASFAVKIGYPNKWRDYSALDIQENDLVGNVLRSREFVHQFELNKLGKPVDRDEWHMTPQTVNAYYNPSLNEIVFPAAILQPPFFDIDADDAVNYGAIGAIIGHEISHGFDDQGSQFDDVGNMKNWWTAEDNKKFKEKTQALVQQYKSYEVVKGYHVDGELTLGENIADNSGLAIAYKAYQLSLNGQAAPVLDNLTGEQRFYIGWAQAWREKMKDAQQIEYLKSDPHSPSAVRANATLKNQQPFYDAFKLKEGDKMYLPANKRVTIW